jgi:hypothetical protein
LIKASQVIGQKVYEAQQATAAGGEAAGEGDEVVEAEIVDEGDES